MYVLREHRAVLSVSTMTKFGDCINVRKGDHTLTCCVTVLVIQFKWACPCLFAIKVFPSLNPPTHTLNSCVRSHIHV